jgi:hypothetical protein
MNIMSSEASQSGYGERGAKGIKFCLVSYYDLVLVIVAIGV